MSRLVGDGVRGDRLVHLGRATTLERRGAAAGEGAWQDLANDLRAAIDGEVRFDDGDRALYAADASNYRQTPIGVVVPRHVDDVVEAVRITRLHGAPVLARGGGTSLAGQCCNVAVVLDFSKYVHDVLEIDVGARTARVRPGAYLDDVRDAAAPHGLTFGPDPATHNHCTIGGMIGNDSCGVHSVMAEFAGNGARTADNVEALEVLTYDGVRMRVGPTSPDALAREIAKGGRTGAIYAGLRGIADRYGDAIRARFPRIARRVSGYNLPALLPENGFDVARALVGTEGTCATVLEATLSLIPSPPHRVLLVLGYPSVYEAADAVPAIREHRPIGLEGMDDKLVDYMRRKGLHPDDVALLPEGEGWLIVEFGGADPGEAADRAREVMDVLRRRGHASSMKLIERPERQQRIWELRESGLGATAFVPAEHDTWPGWEDSAVPVDRVGDYLRDLRELLRRYDYDCALYGHFGQGCIHTRIDFDLRSADGIAQYRAFTREAAELVAHRYGGSLSGEHGDGQARGDLLPIMYGDEIMRAFREFRALWDPDGRMNPGKAIDAAARSENLRLGADYAPPDVATHFAFPEDGGSFAHATLRCVGVGECRRHDGGVMCPSYMVTREEKHATRGRAHLLFEMMRGETIADGWRSEAVKESLDLCLACKGCKGECPVGVDVATYKAEFLSHYYEGRMRPRHTYAFGLIDVWARLAAVAPGLANFVTHAPLLNTLAKRLAGVPRERAIPRFARRTFRAWFRDRARPAAGERAGPAARARGERVVLWPDTFNEHFFPDTLAAAVEVLEYAGCEVVVPPRGLCCGRPLYDYGMLDRARGYIDTILDALRDEIRAGTPVVGLEPSCVSVFRDELTNLLPHDEDARRLSAQTVTLGEFLTSRDVAFPRLGRRALLHGHCHHKSVLDFDADVAVLEGAGLELDVLDAGCCGLAGSFGFETDKYDVSMAIGERVLLPAVRAAAPDTLVIADGFSCREQVAHATGRRPLHSAEILRLALDVAGPANDESAARHPFAAEEPVSPQLGPARIGRLQLTGLALGIAAAALATRTLLGGE